MNPRFAWPAVVLAGIGMIVAAGMAALSVDTALIVTVVTLLIVPVLTALISLQLGQMQGQVSQLVQQTNGHQTQMLEIVSQQGKALASSTPVELADPGHVTST